MKLPSKVTPFQESVLPKLPLILTHMRGQRVVTPYELYTATKENFKDILEFMDALTCLVLLRKIKFNQNSGTLYYVTQDLL